MTKRRQCSEIREDHRPLSFLNIYIFLSTPLTMQSSFSSSSSMSPSPFHYSFSPILIIKNVSISFLIPSLQWFLLLIALWLFNLRFPPLLKNISGRHMLWVIDRKYFYPKIIICQNRRTRFYFFFLQHYCHEALRYAIRDFKRLRGQDSL